MESLSTQNAEYISIHAPRGGSDKIMMVTIKSLVHFNPRSPWGERLVIVHVPVSSPLFQSTLPVGGATRRYCRWRYRHRYFNPRSPWGERLGVALVLQRSGQFQSTLPVGGATRTLQDWCRGVRISIHAPRGGSDEYSWIKSGPR